MIKNFRFSNTHKNDCDFSNVDFESNLDSEEYENDIIIGYISIAIANDENEGYPIAGFVGGSFVHEAVEIEPYKNVNSGDANPPDFGNYHHEYNESHDLKDFEIEIDGSQPFGQQVTIVDMKIHMESKCAWVTLG